jgi:hypothetical protein
MFNLLQATLSKKMFVYCFLNESCSNVFLPVYDDLAGSFYFPWTEILRLRNVKHERF